MIWEAKEPQGISLNVLRVQLTVAPSATVDDHSTSGEHSDISEESDNDSHSRREGLEHEQTSGSYESPSYSPESHSGLNALADEASERPYAATQVTQEDGIDKCSEENDINKT
ncbi:hypothetical protein ACJ72_06425 [Emergomyces africanus]|uniref:Uncharacterized protein n=1 Tax=Emergomyces africanus TaxID=1955775 RepID=A0A1B7NRK0_9EURO|nr:hypothetical protein ACJ72_06425 [Emergomyces africanus]